MEKSKGWLVPGKYTIAHAAEMDQHVMATSIDIGSGRISGFFTNGREDMIAPLEHSLAAVKGLGPFQHINEASCGHR